jgi:hypothetical protein
LYLTVLLFLRPENAKLIGGFAGPVWRLDRTVWHLYNFSLIDIKAWSDIHFLRPLHENWAKVRPVMVKIFDEEEMAVCERYYEIFAQIKTDSETFVAA